MHQKLQAGHDIDVLTPDELKEILAEMLASMQDVEAPANVFDVEFKMTADAAGVFSLKEIFDIPLGYMMTIHRYHINAPGATPAAPLGAAGNYLFFTRNNDSPNDMFMFLPVSGNQIAPVVIAEGSYDARMLRGGTRFMVYGAGFTAGQILYMNFQVKLELWKGAQ